MLRRTLAGLVALGAAAFVSGVPSGATATRTAPGFNAPIVMPGSESGNEPSIAIDSATGIRYLSWQSPGEFARSADGVTWENTGIPDEAAIGDETNAVDAAGALYNGQICGDPQNILHTCIYRSLDGGLTWPQKTELADNHPGASDRPWIEVYPHASATTWDPDQTTVYLEYHTFTPEELVYVTVSRDGGKTFGPPVFITTGTNAIVGSGCNTVPGGIGIDEATGTVYAVWLSGNDVVANGTSGCNYTQIGPFNKAWVSTSTDGGVTWTSHLAWKGRYDKLTHVGDNASKIFATISVDRAGQVHVLLAVRNLDNPEEFAVSGEEDPRTTALRLVTSPDGGAHWTPPFRLHPRLSGSEFFPWIAAGSEGIVDTVYYASHSLKPNEETSEWFIVSSQIRGAIAQVSGSSARYVGSPQVTNTLLDPEVVHVGGICTFGIFCLPGTNRNLADSIAIALDPAGGANVTYTVDAPGQIGENEDSHIEFACQSSGPSAYEGMPDLSGCYQGGP